MRHATPRSDRRQGDRRGASRDGSDRRRAERRGSGAREAIGRLSILALVLAMFQVPNAIASADDLVLDTWIVSFADVPTVEDLEVLEGIAVEVHGFQHLPAAAVVVSNLDLGILRHLPGVTAVHANEVYEPAMAEATATTGATLAWDLGFDGDGIGVAIVDTGIDGTHPDLCASAVFCAAGEEVKTVQNVKILGRESRAEPVVFLEDQVNTDTSSGHGSHVAGIAAGNGSASQSEPYKYRGVAPSADLVGLGVGDLVEAVNVLAAFDWILENHQTYNIKVVNNSWGPGKGTPYDPAHPVNRAVDAMFAQGIVTTFGAGNDGPTTDTMNAFSVHPQAVSVAGGTKEGHIAFFSSRGVPGSELWRPDITTPGYMIVAARASTGFYGDIGDLGNANFPNVATEDQPYYATNSGTSMASPHAAGIVALMQQAAFEARGEYLTPTQVLDLLRRTATRDGNGGPGGLPNYQSYTMGAGYANAAAAVQAAFDGTDLGAWDDGVVYDHQSFADTVPAGTLVTGGSFQRTIQVQPGAISLDVMMDWTVPANDLDIELRGPNGESRSTFLGCAPQNEPNGYSSFCTNIANERINVNHPSAGTWTATFRGAVANAEEAVTGGWSVAYPDDGSATISQQVATSVTLTSDVPVQVMGQPVELTAIATDANGDPVPGATVTWTEDGVGDLAFGEVETHATGWAMGQAQASSGLGTQTITATVDGVSASVDVLWIGVPELPLPDPDPEDPQNTPGEVAGGGWFTDDGTKVTFGLHAEYHAGDASASGEVSVTEQGGTRTRSDGVQYLVIDGNTAWVQGPATVDGQGGYTYTLELVDNGSPGKGSDTFRMTVTDGFGYFSEVQGTLGGGNLTIAT